MRRILLLCCAVCCSGCAAGLTLPDLAINQPRLSTWRPDTLRLAMENWQPDTLKPTADSAQFRHVPVERPRSWTSLQGGEGSGSGGNMAWITPAPTDLVERMVSPNDIPYQVVERRWVKLTVYNSDPGQTDGTPWIGASGRLMIPKDAASNGLRIGTRFRIPSIFGQEIFTIEDRMRSDHGPNDLDAWTYHIGDAYRLSRAYELARQPIVIEILGPPDSTAPR